MKKTTLPILALCAFVAGSSVTWADSDTTVTNDTSSTESTTDLNPMAAKAPNPDQPAQVDSTSSSKTVIHHESDN